MDLVFQLQQLVALGREHAGDRDSRPLADDLGDLFGIDLFLEQPAGLLGLAVAQRLGLGDPFFESFSLGVERGQRLELRFVGPLAALLHVADLVPGAAVLDLDRVESLADFLDVAQARLFHLPLPAQVLELLFDLADLVLDLGQAVEGMLFLFVTEHSLGKLELKQPALQDVDLGRHRLQLHRQPAGRLVDQVDRLVRQESVGDVPRRTIWPPSPAPSL